MMYTEFVLTSSLIGFDSAGKQTAGSVFKTSLLLPENQPEIYAIKKIHAVIVQKELSISKDSIVFDGKIKLLIGYESGSVSTTQEEFITFIPFSFCGQKLETEKEPDSINAEFILEYLKLVLKSPGSIFLESSIFVLYE